MKEDEGTLDDYFGSLREVIVEGGDVGTDDEGGAD